MNTLSKLLSDAVNDGSTSVIKVARILGKSRQHVYDILARKTTPSLADAEAIAKEIGCEIVVKTKAKTQNRKKYVK